MPLLFIGHGSPMNAIEKNEFTGAWENIARELPSPKAILCVSAHWYIDNLAVGASSDPKIIYDFYGFPDELYKVKYPVQGSPEFAEKTARLLSGENSRLDYEFGLDHGTWSVLCRMFPDANIPTYQLSINGNMPPEYHFELGNKIRELRSNGVLIIGSGNIVHNLRMMKFEEDAYDWAAEFDYRAMKLIEARRFEDLIYYNHLGKDASLSIPTPDHYYPLLYILGAASKEEEIKFFAEGITLGSISMRSLLIG